jgi:hypothetical protein
MPELLAAEKAGDCAGRYLTAIAIGRRVSKGNGRLEIYGSDRLPVRRAHHILTRVYANAKNAVSVYCHHPWKSPHLAASEALFVFLDLSFCDCVHSSLLDIWIILCRWRARVGCCLVSAPFD